jgi:outer membrane protein insertion porin family
MVFAASLLCGGEPAVTPVEEPVVDLQIIGNQVIPQAKILRHIHTRVGRPFNLEVIEEDVRRLNHSGMFIDVKPFSQQVPGGRAVVFQVVERPVLEEIRYVGNKKIKTKVLEKEVGLKANDPLDPFAVEEARRKLEQFYRDRGFSRVRVTIWEGDQPGDRRVVFLINEGCKQRILWTQFVGNTIATDARLRTQIKSKPGILWFIKGEVDYQQIAEDVKRLKAYYSSLGFARARIGRELSFNEDGDWLTLTFVVDEGPRFQVRKVSFIGNRKFSEQELAANLKLKDGQYFNQQQMNSDLAAIQEKYGSVGYIFCDIQPEMRYLENQDQFDVVYNVSEGDRYRVGRIRVEIQGEYPHTQITTVLNRLSLSPGDIVDIRNLRESERRLRRSGLFEIDPAKGVTPKIVFSPPELDEHENQVARPPRGGSNPRGQSPDLVPCGGWRLTQAADSRPGDRRVDLTLPCRRVGPAAGESPPMVVRAQFSPEGGQVVPELRPRLPWMGGQRPTAGSAAQPPAGRYSAPPETTPSDPPPPTNQYAPAPAADLGGPLLPGPGYAAQPPSGSPLPYGGGAPPAQLPANEGVFSEDSPFLNPQPDEEPTREIDIFPTLQETQTGRLMMGAGINSDLGFVGSFVIDEQNFDWTRFPRNWEEIRNATAWRGAGQRFRLEAVPGTQVQRYMVNFQEPYLMNTAVSLGLSGFFYDRRFYEWKEQRLGGRVSLGYQFTHDLAGSLSFRGEKINVHDPIVPLGGGLPELDEVLGDNALYGFGVQLTHDTRDSAFLATEGHLIELSLEQVIGSFQYPRAELDLRRYFLIHERPDGSGRHVLSLSARFGWTGTDTPIYDHYYAGGFSTLRGFDFRSVSPRNPPWWVPVGGEVLLLASVQYLFPITADDMLRGVVFCDTGTVERTIDNWRDTYRISPGFGLRIVIPAMGPAPIALDFAFPVASQAGDHEEVFSFFVGFNR